MAIAISTGPVTLPHSFRGFRAWEKMKMADEPETTPYPDAYLKYQSRQEKLDRFYALTQYSVLFTAFSLTAIPADELKKVRIPLSKPENGSMIPRAARAKDVHVQRGWVTYQEYAKESGLELHAVEEGARQGTLGPIAVIPETGENVLFWAPGEQRKPLAELPPPSKTKTYSVTLAADTRFSIRGDWEEGEKARDIFLKLASSQGDPQESSEHSLALLRQVCFVQEWSSFEVYIRDTIALLLRKHPQKIGATGKGKKTTLSPEEVIEMSQGFTSIEELRERMVQREIDRRQEEGQSVHGLINFLKDEFRFARDPYVETYILLGNRATTHYNDLAEIKDVRNALMHDGGAVSASFFTKWPRVPQAAGEILITDEYYLMALLVLRAVGFGIADSIARNQYAAD